MIIFYLLDLFNYENLRTLDTDAITRHAIQTQTSSKHHKLMYVRRKQYKDAYKASSASQFLLHLLRSILNRPNFGADLGRLVKFVQTLPQVSQSRLVFWFSVYSAFYHSDSARVASSGWFCLIYEIFTALEFWNLRWISSFNIYSPSVNSSIVA